MTFEQPQFQLLQLPSHKQQGKKRPEKSASIKRPTLGDSGFESHSLRQTLVTTVFSAIYN
jgi:hypothetical protein